MSDATLQFRDAMRSAGLTPPEMIEGDGKLRRFASNGKRTDDAGWYVLHDGDLPAGAFGDWRTGINETWRSDTGRSLTAAEQEAHRARVEAMRREREAEDARRHAEAAYKAMTIWQTAMPARDDHPYLTRKGVKACETLREIHADEVTAILGYRPQAKGEPLAGRLLVAPVKVGATISTAELIDEEGNKSAIFGGAKGGGFWAAQPLPQSDEAGVTLLIGEGVATVLSAKEASGHAVVAALSAGNLPAVAKEMHERYPAATLVILADLVKGTGEPDPHAIEAVGAVGGRLAVPDFGTDRPEKATDFNDLAKRHGAESVRRAIVSAQAPPDAAGVDTWSDPVPLPNGLAPVAAFDFALLPQPLTAWAEDITERMQCAPDFVAVAIMAGLGSIIGLKLGMRPQGQTDWTETANQWAITIGRPGVLKSPAIEAALFPIKRLAAAATEAYQVEIEQYRVKARVAKITSDVAEKSARQRLEKTPGADVSQLLSGDDPEAPTMRRYIAVDSNAASLGELHRQNHNGLLVHRDEIVSLLRGLDREDQAEARGFYLTGWNGNSSYTFDRIGRGLNLHIPAVCLSLLGSTQPGRIADYIRHAVRGGAGDDGLIQRFGLLVWPDTDGPWRNVDRLPDGQAKSEAYRIYKKLDTLDPATVGAQQDKDHDGEPDGIPYLRFDETGQALFLEWRTALEARLRGGDLHPALESHLAKYRTLVPSLALILHLASDGAGPIPERATLQALAWAEYLETHAQRAYGSVTAPDVAAAKAILLRIGKGDLPRKFSSRDVWRPQWSKLTDREQVADALRLLVDYEWLRLTEDRDTGGRPATVYTVNPRGIA